jgi:nucleoside phosphorylase
MYMREAGIAQAAISTADAVRDWNPAAVIIAGIAGAFRPDEQQLGDVVVPATVL